MHADFINKTEPDSLGWNYHQSGEKVSVYWAFTEILIDFNAITEK
jgi:hypothetical protein